MNNIFDLSDEETAPIYDNTSQLIKPTMPWLEELNPEQKQAVLTTEGPLLVLSGAGTGKTKVLTTRLAYILANMKANPWNCLVVTFTNRAAREMRERAHNLIGNTADSVWMGTFHGICAKILRNHAELVGLKSNFTILGEDDQKRLIKQICEAEGIDDKKYPPQAILDKIQLWKDKGLTVDKIGDDFRANILTDIYKRYQARLIELNCVDFGDILLYTQSILMSDKEVLAKYQERFKYIMVDEYQDTNVTQYLFLRLISQKHRNLCCVGDDDQSIYSWRGAEIENILRFEKDFPDAQVIRLERNYRSTANILSAASALISHNQGRLGKSLHMAENSPVAGVENCKVKVVSNYSGTEEASYITSEIENLYREGFEYSSMAVLVRTAAQTREFEERFIAEAIPYQVIGGPKFYERAEIRDAMAYLRVVLQPNDDLALERIINKPARGIGAKTVEKFQQMARAEGISMYMAVEKMLSEGLLSGKVKTNISDLLDKFYQWQQNLNAVTPDELASQILDDSGYMEMLKMDKSVEAEGRIENLKELINVMSDTNQYQTLAEFMEHVSLVMDKDNNLDTNKVTLITLHSAKGLEFDAVFLPGWEEGLFPHQRALDEGGTNSLEEERRLAYVAMTRAKKKLFILMALNRRIYGQWQQNLPSRFINELPPKNIDIQNNAASCFSGSGYNKFGGGHNNSGGNYYGGKSWYNKSQNHSKVVQDSERFSYESDDFGWNSQQIYQAKQKAVNQASETPVGTKVFHETFGYGKVLNIVGNKLEIWFDEYGHKKILKDYVKKV